MSNYYVCQVKHLCLVCQTNVFHLSDGCVCRGKVSLTGGTARFVNNGIHKHKNPRTPFPRRRSGTVRGRRDSNYCLSLSDFLDNLHQAGEVLRVDIADVYCHRLHDKPDCVTIASRAFPPSNEGAKRCSTLNKSLPSISIPSRSVFSTQISPASPQMSILSIPSRFTISWIAFPASTFLKMEYSSTNGSCPLYRNVTSPCVRYKGSIRGCQMEAPAVSCMQCCGQSPPKGLKEQWLKG